MLINVNSFFRKLFTYLSPKSLCVFMSQDVNVIIGLECHVQLINLKTKLFCSCSSDYRSCEPNLRTCPVCLGLPGSLPVLNQNAIDSAIKLAMALNSSIPDRTFFYRKQYFYPDMSKNYQISQYDTGDAIPIASGGQLTFKINNETKYVGITRIQLEEDPAKLVHIGAISASKYSLVDYNRCGMPLCEIVTDPDLRSPKEARLFLQKMRSILEHLGLSDGSLDGAMRCDANISIEGGARVEVKNITSFKAVERALNFEITRQKNMLRRNKAVVQETRHFDEDRKITISLRTKETESDYRYFPEPDLVPISIADSQVKEVEQHMPELPDARINRLISEYNLPEYDANVLTADKSLADFFEDSCKLYPKYKEIGNWIMGDLLKYLNRYNLELHETKLAPKEFTGMLKQIESGKISGKIAKMVIDEWIKTGEDPGSIIKKKNLLKITDDSKLSAVIKEVFLKNQQAVDDAQTDKKAINFLVGEVMKQTRGRADPTITNQLILKHLKEKGPVA